MFSDLSKDLRHGLRMFPRDPGFTSTAVLTLALGIGANTAIFSVFYGAILAPLPYRDAQRLVMIQERSLTLDREMSVSYLDLRDWQRGAREFEQMAAFRFQGYNLVNPGTPEHLAGDQVSAGFFSLLGVKPALGRDFAASEDNLGGAPVAILSNHLWRERFGSNADALGKAVTLDGTDYTIVGVLPGSFHLIGDDGDIYTPLGQGNPLWKNDRTSHPGILCIARLRNGVSISRAAAEMAAIQNELNRLYPSADRGLGTGVVPMKQEFMQDSSGTLWMLLAAVGLVLLIACANVANLLLARSAGRAREFAVRAALGAGRGRIVRQLITESVLLAVAGGAVGVIAAAFALKPMLAAMPGLPEGANIEINFPVLLFALGVSLLVGILFGLAPAIQSSAADIEGTLRQGSRGSSGVHQRAQSTLVIVQVALTLVLLSGASLLLRTMYNLSSANPGFDTQHVITFKVGLSAAATKTGPTIRTAYQQLIERIRRIPGVRAADLTTLVPLSNLANAGPFWVGAQQPSYTSEAPRALYYETYPDYLQVMKLPLLRGRYFTPQDTTESEPVIVIDSVLAHAYFRDRDPLGQILTVGHWRPAKIVGVVAHVRHWGLGDPDLYTQNQIYISFNQLADEWVPLFNASVTLVVNTPLEVASVMPAIRAEVYGTGSGQPVYSVRTMQEFARQSMAPQRFAMILLAGFAVLALLLASVGIYGLISYWVAQRVHEIGIRMALGAERHSVLRMVMGHGVRLAVAGLAIGVIGALALTRLLSSFSKLLYGVGGNDPLTFAAVSVALMGVAVLACYIPARRATRTDPAVALRCE
jgi:predicted permease